MIFLRQLLYQTPDAEIAHLGVPEVQPRLEVFFFLNIRLCGRRWLVIYACTVDFKQLALTPDVDLNVSYNQIYSPSRVRALVQIFF